MKTYWKILECVALAVFIVPHAAMCVVVSVLTAIDDAMLRTKWFLGRKAERAAKKGTVR